MADMRMTDSEAEELKRKLRRGKDLPSSGIPTETLAARLTTPVDKKPEPEAEELDPVAPVDESTTRELPPTSLSNTIRDTANTTSSIVSTPLPPDTDVRDLLDQLGTLKREEPEGDWDHLESEAKRLYQEKADRNSWLDLAQTIGQGLSRLYAADQGLKHGVDMSGFQPVKGTDYGEKTERAGKDYLTELERIERSRGRAEKRADAEFDRKLQTLKERIGGERAIYGEKMDTYRSGERAAADRARQDRADDKYQARLTAAEEKEQARIRSQEIRELSAQKKELDQAVTLLSTGKSKDASKAGIHLAKAGLDTEDIEAVDAAQVDEGLLFDSKNPKKAIPVVKEKLKSIEERLRALKAGRSSGSKSTSTPPSTGAGSVTSSDVSNYAKQYFSGNVDAARKYLEDQGYAISE